MNGHEMETVHGPQPLSALRSRRRTVYLLATISPCASRSTTHGYVTATRAQPGSKAGDDVSRLRRSKLPHGDVECQRRQMAQRGMPTARVVPAPRLDTDARRGAGFDQVVRASSSHSSVQRWIHCRRTAHARSAVENARHPALLARFIEQTAAGNVPMQDATRILGLSRQTVLQRVKRGELDAVHVHHGKRKGPANQGARRPSHAVLDTTH